MACSPVREPGDGALGGSSAGGAAGSDAGASGAGGSAVGGSTTEDAGYGGSLGNATLDGGSAGAAGSSGVPALDAEAVETGSEDAASDLEPGGWVSPTVGTENLFAALLGVSEQAVRDKLTLAVERIFGIGTTEPNLPIRDSGYRVYYELPQDPSAAFIWAADSEDVRSEGMSYGMMIAVQMDMQTQFDRLWRFARTYMQYPANSPIAPWRHYFRWQGSVTADGENAWNVSYGAETGPAPDGEEYFAAALYLAHRRWGSGGAIDYRARADEISSAMLHNPPGADGRVGIVDGDANMVVFYPHGTSASFSDPSYHLPAFYELFALDGPPADSQRWQDLAEVSRQYLVDSAHATTGLHPDYANFDGTPNSGGSRHDEFRYDAWRVVMNMAVDHAWFSGDSRMQAQVEKYHVFFHGLLTDDNVENSLFQLDGSGPEGGGSTALTATLATGALTASVPTTQDEDFVRALWNVPQQSGTYRYYQELVYALGLLAAAGQYGYAWPD